MTWLARFARGVGALARLRTAYPSQASMGVMAVVFGIFAVSLLVQPQRWGATPAYRNLLIILPQREWGAIFAGVTVLLALAVWRFGARWLSVAAITAGVMVTTGWAAAFVVRWLTSSSTTPETWVSWAVFDYILLRAAANLDHEEVLLPASRRRGRHRG